MAEKKIIRKVITKVASKETDETKEVSETDSKKISGKQKKACSFCQSKSEPTYTDIATLRRFLTDRAKIVPRAKSNLCSKHQRAVGRHIKYARHLSLLPFVPKV